MVQAEVVSLTDGGIGFSQAGQVVINQGGAGVVYAGTVELSDATSGLVVAQEVHAGSLKTSVLLAGRVEGEVETLVDTPRALLFGLATGVALGLVIFLTNLLLGRRK
jgi:hypothetical protein